MTVRPNPETEPSMAKVGWTVQSAFYGRNSHATRENNPSLCREAAQSNKVAGVDAGRGVCLRNVGVNTFFLQLLGYNGANAHPKTRGLEKLPKDLPQIEEGTRQG